MENLANLIRTSIPDSLKNKLDGIENTQTTSQDEKKPFDYWEWYHRPGNTIREYDEAHGISLVRSPEGGMPRFVADIDQFRQENQEEPHTYPEYFANRTFDKFVTIVYTFGNQPTAKKALDYSKAYVKNFERVMHEHAGKGLYFYSKTKGSGKTFLSTILGNELSAIGKKVRWYSMPNLLQDIKSTYDKDSGISTTDVIARAKKADVLMLDDIGVEKQSSWVNETLFSILDERLTMCRPTIFTSNILPYDLAYDERIKDRINRASLLIELPEECVRRRLSFANGLEKILGE